MGTRLSDPSEPAAFFESGHHFTKQKWLKENLKTTKINDGTSVFLVKNYEFMNSLILNADLWKTNVYQREKLYYNTYFYLYIRFTKSL